MVLHKGMEIIPGTLPPKSVILVPITVGNQTKGGIHLENMEREDAFGPAEVQLLTTLASSMGIALENARLFSETQSLLKETEQRNAELQIINSVQQGLAAQLDIQAIYDLVGEKIREIFDAQVVMLGTIDSVNRIEHAHYVIEKGQRFYPPPRELGVPQITLSSIASRS